MCITVTGIPPNRGILEAREKVDTIHAFLVEIIIDI